MAKHRWGGAGYVCVDCGAIKNTSTETPTCPGLCHDHDRPGCLGVVDDRYTMRFDDIGEQPIYWCAWCGRQAQAMTAAINNAFAKRPGFKEEFQAAIERVERAQAAVEKAEREKQAGSSRELDFS